MAVRPVIDEKTDIGVVISLVCKFSVTNSDRLYWWPSKLDHSYGFFLVFIMHSIYRLAHFKTFIFLSALN